MINPLDMYRPRPGGGPACLICGSYEQRHGDSFTWLKAGRRAIDEALKQIEPCDTECTEHYDGKHFTWSGE